MTLPKDLIAASATPIILAILQREETYGYAIIRKVLEISDHQIDWTEGMLYPVLHRLESAGHIRSSWHRADNGRRRKYYAITRTGKAEFEQLVAQWDIVQRALQTLRSEQHGTTPKRGTDHV